MVSDWDGDWRYECVTSTKRAVINSVSKVAFKA